MNTRRHFIRHIAIGVGAPALLVSRALSEEPQKPQIVKEDDPTASALGYKEDTTKVDKAKYPQHRDDQNCSNCILAPVDREGEHIACTAFQNRLVTKKGWCVAWVKKPS